MEPMEREGQPTEREVPSSATDKWEKVRSPVPEEELTLLQVRPRKRAKMELEEGWLCFKGGGKWPWYGRSVLRT
ncbi:UNVERIFIED_CONTAM: hypothetical protein FKN15_072029 [Acipenser sinensis]